MSLSASSRSTGTLGAKSRSTGSLVAESRSVGSLDNIFSILTDENDVALLLETDEEISE